MKVLVLSDGVLKEKEIGSGLEDLQAIVGGYIEVPYISKTLNDNGIDVIINEEGKFIEGLKPEIVIVDKKTQQILDVVMGNCIFASHDAEGETISLSKEQIDIVKDALKLTVILEYQNTTKKNVVRALFV